VSPRKAAARAPEAATVYGGGGLFGIGYLLGITEAFVDAGVPLGTYPALGTSAGTWAAAALALGVRFPEAMEAVGHRAPRVPDPRGGRLRAIAADLFGADTHCPTVRAVVVRLPRLTRVALSGADTPIADLVAASSAVPGMLPPHRIGRGRYVDGGVRSMASVDLADPAPRLLVVLPLAGAMFGPAGRLVSGRTEQELARVQRERPGTHALVVRPTPQIAALARRPDHLFDPARARTCHELAYEEGIGLLDAWAELGAAAAAPRRRP
jgi:NTE family protein